MGIYSNDISEENLILFNHIEIFEIYSYTIIKQHNLTSAKNNNKDINMQYLK